KSPFYGESGGQVGDTGELAAPGLKFEVTDTQKEGGVILHIGHLREGVISQGQTVAAKVDAARREGIRRAPSCPHLLHFALRKHLGAHAQQQGSKVDRDWLRFDFANPKSVGRDELTKIEAEVNALAMSGSPIQWTELPIAEARKQGAMMLFGE